jgi:hypothetical protein
VFSPTMTIVATLSPDVSMCKDDHKHPCIGTLIDRKLALGERIRSAQVQSALQYDPQLSVPEHQETAREAKMPVFRKRLGTNGRQFALPAEMRLSW